MDCFVACAPRNDGRTDSIFKQRAVRRHDFAISPRDPREVCQERPAPEKSEGAGNAGRAMRPQPRV